MKLRTLTILCAGALLMSLGQSCKSEKKSAENAADAIEEAADDMAETAEDMADDAADAVEKTADDAMDSMESLGADLGFESGSWSYNVQQAMANGSTETFVLDKVPFEGEELSEEADAQLNDLAAILKANPNARIVIKGHTKEAKNAVGRNAKKATSKARALWVQTKLSLKGATGDQMRARGMADEELIAGVAGDDDSQTRITITLGTKDSE